jgi:SAM-dependent methyltransferase
VPSFERDCLVADAIFNDRRLVDIYDPLDPDRIDLNAYLALIHEFGVRSIVDIGCGTGTFACLLAQRGKEVTGIDPASASVDVARRKPGADRVRWLVGEATTLPPLQVDVVTMTGNVAQVFLTDDDWAATLRSTHRALRPGGRLVFEVRDPARREWTEWNRAQTSRRVVMPEVGAVETWVDVTDVDLPLVSFRWTFVFESDGVTLVSDSTLRFRSLAEISDSLRAASLDIQDVRDAPDRPGRELVFITRRTNGQPPP